MLYTVYVSKFAQRLKVSPSSLRNMYEGGEDYINEVLTKFSDRELDTPFAARKRMSPSLTEFSVCIQEVCNAVTTRLHLIQRINGSLEYIRTVSGLNGGFLNTGESLDTIMVDKLLPELLITGVVGVLLDTPRETSHETHPYLAIYPRETIIDWNYVIQNGKTTLLTLTLEEEIAVGLSAGSSKRLRHYYLNDQGTVTVLTLRPTTHPVKSIDASLPNVRVKSSVKPVSYESMEQVDLTLTEIPFHVLSLPKSPGNSVYQLQMALTNLESADVGWLLAANYPIYTEQASKYGTSSHLQPSGAPDGGEEVVEVGSTKGRAYSGSIPPAFIAPPSGPIEVSMKKQEKLRQQIRSIFGKDVRPTDSSRRSTATRETDEKPMEAGVAAIGLRLQEFEQAIARYWRLFRPTDAEIVIKYPRDWSLLSDSERYDLAEKLIDIRMDVPSPTFQKNVSKSVVKLVLGLMLDHDSMTKIFAEIDNSQGFTADPDTLIELVRTNLLSVGTADSLMGFPESEASLAAADHVARLERIRESQQASDPSEDADPGHSARNSREAERENATAKSSDRTDGTRGPGVRTGRSRRQGRGGGRESS